MYNKTNLFQFGVELPGKLKDQNNGFKLRWSQNDVTTIHLPDTVVAQKRALNTDTKFYHILRMMVEKDERKAFIGQIKNGYVAEIQESDVTQLCIATMKKNVWNFKVGIMDANGTITAYPDGKNCTVMLLSLIPEIMRDLEAATIFNEIQPMINLDPDADDWDFGETAEKFSKMLCMFSNNVYYRIMNDTESDSPITVDTNFTVLRQNDIKKSEVLRKLYGSTAKCFQMKQDEIKKETVTVGKYRFSGKELTDQELMLVPKINSSYCTPMWVESLCTQIKESTSFEQPFRTLLLSGPSGSGKTTGTKAMAAYLGMPYVKITCSPDSDIFDFIGQLIPNVTGDESEGMEAILNAMGIPTFEDVENDFEGSYQKLFGKEPGKMASPSDCYNEIMTRIMKEAHSCKDFTYVESDLIKAVKNGWFCEIQEPTVIKRSSVMVGLNSILESESCGASYTLPTGQLIKRHPDCVICFTTNSDYEGCNRIQQSVLSRMDIVREVPNPSSSELAARTMAQTGFKDEVMMLKMSELIGSINEYCREKDITDGICGPRELANWVKMSMITAKMLNEEVNDKTVCMAAFPTLISKVSQDKEDAEEIITGCLKIKFSSNDIEEARLEYEEGRI